MLPVLPCVCPARHLLAAGLFLIGLMSAFGAPKPQAMPRLFFGNEDIPGLQSRLASDFGKAIMERQRSVISEESLPPYLSAHAAAGFALRQILLGKQADADKAHALMELGLGQLEAGGNLSKEGLLGEPEAAASQLAALAICLDLSQPKWPESFRNECAQRLLRQAKRMAIPAPNTTRNQLLTSEKALASAASGLAALAASSDPSIKDEAMEVARQARQVITRHIAELGDHGWPRDSLPSLRLALSHGLGAFLCAWRRSTSEDLFTQSPARHWSSLYSILLLPLPAPDKGATVEVPLFGLSPALPSKEPGPRWPGNARTGGDLGVLMSLADAASRSALLWNFEQCYGPTGDGSLDIRKGSDALFILLGAAAPEAAINPARTMGRVWRDDEAGVLVLRNRWQDANDFIAMLYANPRPSPLLPSFADAGSFRLIGLGGRWAVRRQQDEGDLTETARECENVVIIPGTHGWLGGRLIETRGQQDGSGSMVVDLDAVCSVAPNNARGQKVVTTFDIGIRAKRAWAIDYSGNCGAPVLIGMVDEIQNGPPRRWQMHTEEKDIRLTEDGFEIKATNGASLRGHVLCPERPRLSIKNNRWTRTICIDGESNFFIVMTIQEAKAPQPSLRVEGEGLASKAYLGKAILRHDGNGIAIR